MAQLVTYHIKISSERGTIIADREAANLVEETHEAIVKAGGDVSVSWAFGVGNNILVVELPEGVDITQFYPNHPADKFVEVSTLEGETPEQV